MNRWYRQSLPPRSWVYLFIGLVLLVDFFAAVIWVASKNAVGLQAAGPVLMIGAFGCAFAAMILAGFKIQRFPAVRLQNDFHSWLALTPWQPTNRTPFGPWHPIAADLIPLGFLTVVSAIHAGLVALGLETSAETVVWRDAPAWRDSITFILAAAIAGPALAYLSAWTVAGYGAIWRGWRYSVYLPALWVGLLCHLAKHATLEVLAMAGLLSLGVAMIIVWRRMNWLLTRIPQRHLASSDEPPKTRSTSIAFAALSPRPQMPDIAGWMQNNRRRAFAFALLVFVWLTVPTWESEVFLLVSFCILVIGLIRWLSYKEKLSSHLSLAARWATRQFIIPAYDLIWIPSLLIVLTGSIFLALTWLSVLSPTMGGALSIAVPVWVGMSIGPNYQRWSLTVSAKYHKTGQPQQRNSITARRTGLT